MSEIILKYCNKLYLFLSILVTFSLLPLSACTWLHTLGRNIGNQEYVDSSPAYHGIQRLVIFLRRWPCYLKLPHQASLGSDYITPETRFFAPWEPAVPPDPRAVDVSDIDDELVGRLILRDLGNKGYKSFLVTDAPLSPGPGSVKEVMAKYQAFSREADAFLFVYYSPTLFVSVADQAPPEHLLRPFSLTEIIGWLAPGQGRVLWAGPRASLGPRHSISHAHIYLTMSLFKALDGQPLWQVADSRVHSKVRVILASCPPSPTAQNYWADADIIRRLMHDNLKCRLVHLVPDAIPNRPE